MDISIETTPYEDMEDAHWKGWKSVVTDSADQVLTTFYHKDRHARTLWASGFFEGLEYKENSSDWIENYSGAQM